MQALLIASRCVMLTTSAPRARLCATFGSARALANIHPPQLADADRLTQIYDINLNAM
jgi:hypothetical protein